MIIGSKPKGFWTAVFSSLTPNALRHRLRAGGPQGPSPGRALVFVPPFAKERATFNAHTRQLERAIGRTERKQLREIMVDQIILLEIAPHD